MCDPPCKSVMYISNNICSCSECYTQGKACDEPIVGKHVENLCENGETTCTGIAMTAVCMCLELVDFAEKNSLCSVMGIQLLTVSHA